MPDSDHRVSEDQFLGALLGLAIGDALGRPLAGMTAGEIGRKRGVIVGFAPPEGENEPAGEISDKTEVALCIVESLTTNDGMIDPVNINVRFGFLVQGMSGERMSETTRTGIAEAAGTDGLVDASRDDDPELAVAIRGVPVGLLHAVGSFDDVTIAEESALAARLTHGGVAQSSLVADVATAVALVARFPADSSLWSGAERHPMVRELVERVARASTFEECVFAVVAEGGDADSRGALAGALAGVRVGASGVPQGLIDGLDARIYLSLAAPWFYRTALRRAGTIIDLREIR